MSRIKVSSAKAKGRKLQQFVRDKITWLLKPWGIVAEDVKSAVMGESGEDIQLSPFARARLPISVECKAHKSFAVYKLYDQAESSSGEFEPVLVIKADRRQPLAVIDLNYYLLLEDSRIKMEDTE